jgi:trimeric autotransporter adhesin
LTDNALNAASPEYTTQSILLSGIGTGNTQQTITFGAIPPKVDNSTVALMATSSSGLPVSLTSTTPTICLVSGSAASLLAAGNCTIQANQAGNSVYDAAPAVTQSFAVTLLAQTISFSSIPNQVLNTSAGITLSALASSGLQVNFTSTTPAVCTVSPTTLTATLLAVGTCTLQANQAGGYYAYAAAPTVTQSFTVESASPLTGMTFGVVNIGSASARVGVPVTFGAAATLGSVSVLTQGATGLDFANANAGTCTVGSSYNDGASCTVNVSFTPTLAGTRYGAVVLEDGSGNVAATGYLQGTGVGPQINFPPGTESTVTTSALASPTGVAVDGSGNIYIADSNNNRVLKETLTAGSFTESTVPTSALSSPSGVAVDGGGNLYVADTGNNRILKETPSAASYIESTVTSSPIGPSSVAVDGSGNVYIAASEGVLVESLSAGSYTETIMATSDGSVSIAVDESGSLYIASYGLVLKETLSNGSYTESTVTTSVLADPYGVAVDSSGNLYVADSFNNRILKETLSGGGYTESTVQTSALSFPSGVAVDGRGNVYVADTENDRVLKEDLVDAPSASFAATSPGLTSNDSPQTVTLENVGNATLNFPIPSNGNNPNISENFTLNSNGVSSCPLMSASSSTAGTLAVGQSCLLPISFTPTVAGNLSGTLVLIDNALNAASPGYMAQSIILSGTGTSAGTGNLQQSITLDAIPAQTINSTVALTATASSGLPVSFNSNTPGICTIAGSAASLLAFGTCTVQANQIGNSVYAAAPTVTQSFTVTLEAQMITFGALPNQALNTSVAVALIATASSDLPVSFTSTTPTVCTISGSTASLLAPGTCTVQANQTGNGIYASALTATQSFTVETANPLAGTSFGAVNIGSTSATIAVPVTFGTAATLGSVSVSTQGATGLDFANANAGSCMVGSSYNAGASCTVKVSFTPTLAGTRYGAVVLEDGSGNVVATSYLQGSGIGPQLNFLPGGGSTVSSSALRYPSGVAVDASDNIYIADTYNNRILKEAPSAGSYTETTVPTSALAYPYSIAVDGSGSVYITDTGNNRILKETPSTSGYTESTVPTSSLSWPYGIAVDGSGNVYIADTYNDRILEEMLSAGSYTESIVSTSALVNPYDVAVDGSGSVYITDTGNNRVLKETLSSGSYTESTVPATNLNSPVGIAVDGGNNLYVVEYGYTSGNSAVIKETLSAGSYIESTMPIGNLNGPLGVAVDGGGNIYITDTFNNSVLKEDVADPPSLSFAATAPGSTSSDSPQTVTLENVGNAPLNFPIPINGNNPSISANFTLNGAGESACPLVSAGSSTAGILFAGHSCLLPISFTPTSAGNLSGSLALTNNALNAAPPGYAEQNILLSGTGMGSTQQTINFALIPNQTLYSTFALTATASSGLPVSFTSSTPSSCTLSGSIASLIAAGICTFQANQAGSSVYAAAPAVTESFAVNFAAQTIAFDPIPNQAVNTSVGMSLTAAASSELVVSFISTSPTICTVSGSTASLLAAGICTIQASQPGDGVVYAAAPTVAQSFTVESANPLTGASFGTVNIGSASATVSVPVTFGTAATLGSMSVLTQGVTGLDFANANAGTCTVGSSYNAGVSCTVNISFTPTLPGSRYGAVVLEDGSSNVIATSYLQGMGVGPQANFLPGVESNVTANTASRPWGVAVDGSGNIYIADASHYRILKETLSAGSYTVSTVPTSFLNYPIGIAVDASGSIYIADSVNSNILKETLSGSGYTESTVPTSVTSPSSVAVDGSGNVYVRAGFGVLVESPSVGGYTESMVSTTEGSGPIAVDGSGNIYIIDYGVVLKETLSGGSYTESTVPSSVLSDATAIAVDGSGNLYIVNYYGWSLGDSSVLKETVSAGSYIENIMPTSALNYPQSVAVDGFGNVYIADTNNYRALKEDFSDPPTLSFALTTPGSTSLDSPQTVTLENVGNAALSFPIPSDGNNPEVATNFTLNSGEPSACPQESSASSTAGTLAAGQSCQLPISFTPSTSGNLSGALTLTDNVLNAAAPGYAVQNILLGGTGAGSSQQSITFGTIPVQTLNSSLALTATASSGLPVGFVSMTSSICSISGSTASLVVAGICTIRAHQAGSSVYAAAPEVTQSFTVTFSTQTITFGTIANQTLDTSIGLTLTATASSGLPVSFTSTTPAVCAVSGSTISLLAPGTCTIQAAQTGNLVYMAAPTVTESFTIASAGALTGTNFGTVNIGSASATVAVLVSFATGATLGSLSVLTQGATGFDFTNANAGSCTVGSSYSSGGSCTVNVGFTPTLAGSRYGAVVIDDDSGNVVATGYLQGMGVGPQINFLPGAESTVPSSALVNPSGVVVDVTGNIYIADAGNNRVLKETLAAGSYTESTVPTSALNDPSGLAVDGSGNLYVADSGNQRVLIEIFTAGTYSESTVPTSAIGPSSVAVDGSGNVYIADVSNQRVLNETRSATGYTETTVPTSSLNDPSGLAVDGNGNVFIVDSGNNRVLKETLSQGNYSESALPVTALNSPSGVAVDGGGDVYITNSSSLGINGVLKLTLSGGSYVESALPTGTLNGPSAVAVDGSGNVYVSDTGNNRVLEEDFADPPTLSFAATAMGSTSGDSPRMMAIQNVGNAALSFPIPSDGNSPNISANFTLNSNGVSSCPLMSASSKTAGMLAARQSCSLPISFTPTVTGDLTGSVVLTDNALNAVAPGYAGQSILLTGTGTQAAQSINFALPTSPVTYGVSPIALSASATSGLAVILTVVSGPGTVSGTTLVVTGVGTVTVAANQAGNGNYAAAPQVTQSIVVSSSQKSQTSIVAPSYSFKADKDAGYIVPEGWSFRGTTCGGISAVQNVSSSAITGVTGTYYWAPMDNGQSSSPYGTETATLTSASSLCTFAANTQYTLTVALCACDPIDSQVGFQLPVNDVAVISFIAPTTGTGILPSSGLSDYSLTFNTSRQPQIVGLSITVGLAYTFTGENGRNTYFDNVLAT